MPEHNHSWAGIPPQLLRLMVAREVPLEAVILYTTIQSLQGSKKGGCWASNEYLAKAVRLKIRMVQYHLATLKKLNLIEVKVEPGQRRIWTTEEIPGYLIGKRAESIRKGGCNDITGEGCNDITPISTSYVKASTEKIKEKKVPAERTRNVIATIKPATPSAKTGFGLVEQPDTSPATEFDLAAANKLFAICQRYLTPQHGRLKTSKPSAWAEHFRLLRTVDKADEASITKALEWFDRNVGGKHTPHAFNGEAFRKKFPNILHQAERDLFVVEVGPKAKEIAERLEPRSWPLDCREKLPAAVQTCLTAYGNWITARNKYVGRLEALGKDMPKEDRSLFSLGRHLKDAMPPPDFFVQRWLEEARLNIIYRNANGRWNGNLQPYLFHPTSEEFQRMGRNLTNQYCANPDRWDVLFAKITVEEGE